MNPHFHQDVSPPVSRNFLFASRVSEWQCSSPGLNCEGSRPDLNCRTSTARVPCQTSTASAGRQCSRPDLNRQLRTAVFQPQPPAPDGSVPRRTSTASFGGLHKHIITKTHRQHTTTTHNHSTQPQTHNHKHKYNTQSQTHNHKDTPTAHNQNTEPQRGLTCHGGVSSK